MTLIKLAGLSILMTLSFQNILVLGETFLTAETGKESGLKAPEKRTNNFRVPMEMPYDPNFWPARGRRSRRDPEKTSPKDNCIVFEGSFAFDKTGLRCPEGSRIREEDAAARKSPPLDFGLMPTIYFDDDLLSKSEKTESNRYGNTMTSKTREQSKERLGMKIPQVLETNLLTNPKRFDEFRLKQQQRRFSLPELIFYGNGVYWEPENLYGEKMKKQDIFWVARGKKTLNFPQK